MRWPCDEFCFSLAVVAECARFNIGLALLGFSVLMVYVAYIHFTSSAAESQILTFFGQTALLLLPKDSPVQFLGTLFRCSKFAWPPLDTSGGHLCSHHTQA